MGGMMGGFGGYGWIGLILNLVITIGVIVGLVILIVWAVRRISAGGQSFSGGERNEGIGSSPRGILDTRYARGEITREQYKDMLAEIDL